MSQTESDKLEARILVLFPTRPDAAMCQTVLRQAGLKGVLCADLHQLCGEFESGGAAAMVLTEEALAAREAEDFLGVLACQPPWSDIPVVVLMQGGVASPTVAPVLERMDNVVLLPRPIQVNALISAVRSAVRARHRQYQVREYLEEQRRVEEALRRSEARLVQAVRVGGLGSFEHDHLADTIECSPLLREVYGWGQDERVTLPGVLERVAPEDRERVAAAIRQAHDPAGRGMYEIEHRVATPDGGIRWVSVRSQTFFEGEGSRRRAVRTVGAVLEITERKQAEEVLARSKEELERLVAERTAKLEDLVGELEHFSYTITHDMRAPLRAMRSFSSLVLDRFGSALPPFGQDYLQRIARAADRMDELIVDALDYNKAVRQELSLSSLEPVSLLRGMIESYPAFQPPQANIQIEGKLPLVLANEAGLTQCFSNLLNNAVKFVEPGQVPQVRIWAETRDSMVRLWFEDKGIGIPVECQERIFDMFQRLSHDYEGTGIGLALVRKVAERMGGKVGVESEEGKGSRFWLDLRPASQGGLS